MVDLTRAEVEQADLVILLVDHDDFDLALLEGACVLDTRRVLPPADGVEQL